MAHEKAPILLRLSESVCIIIALSLVAAGYGYCFKTVGLRCSYEDKYSIDKWDDSVNDPQLKGQYYIFLSSMVIALLTLAGLFMIICQHSKANSVGIAISVTCILLSLLNGSIEAWYASGFSSNDPVLRDSEIVIFQSWAAATALYFGATLLYAWDFAIARGII